MTMKSILITACVAAATVIALNTLAQNSAMAAKVVGGYKF